jgi:hypothetical protein
MNNRTAPKSAEIESKKPRMPSRPGQSEGRVAIVALVIGKI